METPNINLKPVPRTKNLNLPVTDADLSRFMLYFESMFKDSEEINKAKYAKVYAEINDEKLFYLVDKTIFDKMEHGYVIPDKGDPRTLFIIMGNHTFPIRMIEDEKYSDYFIVSRSRQNTHEWEFIPQCERMMAANLKTNMTGEPEYKEDDAENDESKEERISPDEIMIVGNSLETMVSVPKPMENSGKEISELLHQFGFIQETEVEGCKKTINDAGTTAALRITCPETPKFYEELGR